MVGWPFGKAAHRDARPEALPDGRPWPRVRVLTIPCIGAAGLAATVASVVAQAYPEARHDVVAAGPAASDALRAAVADPSTDYLLLLRAGDLLAPGALAALCLDAALMGADAVAGLRVLFDRSVLGLDVLAAEAGRLDEAAAHRAVDEAAMGGVPFTGGEILLARAAVARAGGLDPDTISPIADLWPRLAASGARLSRIGRPVLLQRDPGGAARTAFPSGALSIAALTDSGHRGGAGVAHRRLTEALALSGHRITDLRLADEASALAAEWTDTFPGTEAAICGNYDLVLAGNLHGATRSTGILGRLSETLPVAAVLHDLFAVTGRCTHPKECAIIARGCDADCPSSTEYPQLAPDRIADAYRIKRAVLGVRHGPLLLANSDWTDARTRALAPVGTPVARIALAFPTGVFRSGDRAALRACLGLPPDDVLVLFAAVIADAPDKGFADLVLVLQRVAGPGVGFVAIGRLDDPASLGLPNLHAPGPIADEATLARWYGACDIHLTASRLETLGQTPIEAGLCGTPTLAYRATGLTDAVIDGVSGRLVEPHPEALAEALEALIADEAGRRRLGAFARIAFESRYSHAAAAMSLHGALAGWERAPPIAEAARLRFSPEMLGRFAFAKNRHAGADGTVAASARPIVRTLRRAKQAVFGRGMPLWMRRALYAATRVRAGMHRHARPD